MLLAPSSSATRPVRTRFAPSPTGYLHIGGARTALYNWLYARHTGGHFILRVEDTDAARNQDAAVQAIFDGLRWLGLDWDEGPGVGGPYGPYAQSERHEIHGRYLDKLLAVGLAYDDEGAIRFRVPDRDIVVNDLVCGEQRVNLKVQGSTRWDPETKENVPANPDLVIRRVDGSYIFHFVNVVDDIEMAITHIIRGEDHLPNTPKHQALYEAFGVEPPIFCHIPLNLNADGSKMSKRDTGASVAEYMSGGFLSEAVCNYIALLGWSPKDDQEVFTMGELIDRFELDAINHSNSRFDFEKCKWLNGEHLRRLPPEALVELARPYLVAAGLPADDPRLTGAMSLARERVHLLTEIPALIAPVFARSIAYDPASVAKVQKREGVPVQLEVLRRHFSDAEPWSAVTVHDALNAAAEELEVKPGVLMLPCRVSVSGSGSGPDLVPLLTLIGREDVESRIKAFEQVLSGTEPPNS